MSRATSPDPLRLHVNIGIDQLTSEVFTSRAPDLLVAHPEPSRLLGGDGDDVLIDGPGSDSLVGGAGLILQHKGHTETRTDMFDDGARV